MMSRHRGQIDHHFSLTKQEESAFKKVLCSEKLCVEICYHISLIEVQSAFTVLGHQFLVKPKPFEI